MISNCSACCTDILHQELSQYCVSTLYISLATRCVTHSKLSKHHVLLNICQSQTRMVSSLQDEERGGLSSVNQCSPDGPVISAIRVIIYVLKMCLHLVEQRMMSVIRSCL